MWNNICNWPRSRLSIVYMKQVSMLLDRRLVVRESKSTMTRERLNRLWARPFDSSSSCIPSWARSRRRWKRRRWKEAVGRKEGYTKYGGKRDDGATRIEKEADEGRRETRRGWDEKFSLASLRCLYTRGSCMAMGHISVLRERGAPPKNQIECKNRINSSCKLESYVCPVGSLSKLSLFLFLFSLSFCSFSFLHTLFTLSPFDPFLFLSRPSPLFLHNQVYKPARMTPPRGKADHLLYFLLFYLSASTKVMWLAGLMKNPLFIDK